MHFCIAAIGIHITTTISHTKGVTYHIELLHLGIGSLRNHRGLWEGVWSCSYRRNFTIKVSTVPMKKVCVKCARIEEAGLHPFQSLQKQYIVFLSTGFHGSLFLAGSQYPWRWIVGICWRWYVSRRNVSRHPRVIYSSPEKWSNIQS